ncbi:MAG: hypothetical protein ACLPQS_15210 [Acidimicrobiales bacterium]
MRNARRHTAHRWTTRLLVPVASVVALVAFGLAPSAASAGRLGPRTVTSSISTLDAHADTTGPIVIASNGTGYVAWQHPASGGKPDTVLFCAIPSGGKCKKPMILPYPTGASTYGITQAFPVLGGEPGVVYVVGPSYVTSTTVIWTSTDSGAKFSKGYIVPVGSYVGDTGVNDVVRTPDSNPKVDYFVVGSTNVGLGFSLTGPLITKCITCSFTFGASGVEGGTLGLIGNGAVEAYWTDATTPTVNYYWSKYDDIPIAREWNGPVKVSTGDNARLVSGPKGLFLLSQDYAGSESAPTRLDVRKWDPSTHKFGTRMTVVDGSSSTESPYIGGFGEDAVTGALYVAWENSTSSGDVMDLWISTDGGTKWSTATKVGKVSSGNVNETRVAVSNGKGFLTFHDADGLHLVDLSHL